MMIVPLLVSDLTLRTAIQIFSSDIFAGQLKSTLECTHCGYQSITFDMFWDLSIPLPRNKNTCTVQECLQLFMSKEELDDNEKPVGRRRDGRRYEGECFRCVRNVKQNDDVRRNFPFKNVRKFLFCI